MRVAVREWCGRDTDDESQGIFYVSDSMHKKPKTNRAVEVKAESYVVRLQNDENGKKRVAGRESMVV